MPVVKKATGIRIDGSVNDAFIFAGAFFDVPQSRQGRQRISKEIDRASGTEWRFLDLTPQGSQLLAGG
jgi:hypothetical protein